MFRTGFYKKTINKYFLLSVFLLLFVFLLGNGGYVYSTYRPDSIIKLIRGRIKGDCPINYNTVFEGMVGKYWSKDDYLPVVLPVLACFPSLMMYLEEVKSTNKKFIITRGSRVNYCISDLLSSLASSALLVTASIALYMVIIAIYFPHKTDVQGYQVLYYEYMEKTAENGAVIPVTAVINKIISQYLRFILYTGKCVIFVKALACLTKNMQYTVGISFFFCYIQKRIAEEMLTFSIYHDKKNIRKMAELINAGFLKNAGRTGFYPDKLLPAVLLELFLMVFWVMIYVFLNQRAKDASEI